MAGRNSKPVQLIKMEGNKDRRTKAELDAREKAEKALYTGTNFREDATTKADPVAHKEFLRLRKLFKHIDFIDGLDQETINRYCRMKSQEQMLQEFYMELKERMDKLKSVPKKLDVYDSMKEVISKQNQVRDKMLKLEDKLFLNPVSRMRAVPKKPIENEIKKSPMSQFLNKRSGDSHGS